ncbi:MAG: Na-translocating system protein MpsC family protein [Thermoleophilaceae bacterium]
MESVDAPEGHARAGDELAEITNGIVRLFSEYYGRGPTRAKTFMLEERYVVTILRDTMTTVERTLAKNGHIDMIRRVRLTFQEAMAASFKGVVEEALGRRVQAYHSQILIEPDVGFEFFLLDE